MIKKIIVFFLFTTLTYFTYPQKIISSGNSIITNGNSKVLRSFKPVDVPGCILWLDAGQGIIKDAANYVSTWSDLSGNNNHFIQQIAISQPKYVPDGGDTINHKPTIKFDKTSDFMECTNYFLYNLPAISVFIVVKVEIGLWSTCGQYNNGIFGGSKSGGAKGFELITMLNTHELRINGNVKYTTGLFKNLIYSISSVSYDNNATVGYINDAKLTPTTGGVALNYNEKYAIGRYAAATCHYAYMFMPEFIIYNRVISVLERRKIMQYLNEKYNPNHLIY